MGHAALIAVDALRAEVPRAVQGHQERVAHRAKLLQHFFPDQVLACLLKHGAQQLRIHPIQLSADMIVAGQSLHPEERPPVITTLGLLHELLVGQEGRALAEEHPEGSPRNIRHGVVLILAFAQVGKRRDGAPEEAEQLLVDPLLLRRHFHQGSANRVTCLGTRRVLPTFLWRSSSKVKLRTAGCQVRRLGCHVRG